jgi:amino acid transporter
VISLPVSWVYAKLAGVFPRSGGDYVYVSRVLHPALGFTSNLSYCIWGMFYVGVSGVFLGVYGVAPLLRVLGAYTSSTALSDAGNWFGEPLGQFLMATGLIAVFTAIFTFGGMRLYFRIQAVKLRPGDAGPPRPRDLGPADVPRRGPGQPRRAARRHRQQAAVAAGQRWR